MTSSLRVTPRAALDLEALGDFLGREGGLDLELRFYEALQATCEGLARQPELGSPCRFRHPALSEVRLWRIAGFPRHLLFYRLSEQGVTILRVLHGRRNWPDLLEP